MSKLTKRIDWYCEALLRNKAAFEAKAKAEAEVLASNEVLRDRRGALLLMLMHAEQQTGESQFIHNGCVYRLYTANGVKQFEMLPVPKKRAADVLLEDDEEPTDAEVATLVSELKADLGRSEVADACR